MPAHSFSGQLCPITRDSFEQVRSWLRSKLALSEGPVVVGVGGPGGCGKSTLSRWLAQALPDTSVLELDDFRLPRDARPAHALYGSHPEGNDLDALHRALAAAKAGKVVRQPVFDPALGRAVRSVRLKRARLYVVDGELAAHQHLRGHFDHLILVQAHWRTQLNTRLTRDLRERKCSLEKAIEVFLQSNLRDYPMYSVEADEADVVLYRNVKHRFRVWKLPA